MLFSNNSIAYLQFNAYLKKKNTKTQLQIRQSYDKPNIY